MNSNLTKKEYIKILKFYKMKIPTTFKRIQHEADKILANKLCKCINQFEPKQKPLPICTQTIFKNKGLTRGKFKCKSPRFVSYSKTKKNK